MSPRSRQVLQRLPIAASPSGLQKQVPIVSPFAGPAHAGGPLVTSAPLPASSCLPQPCSLPRRRLSRAPRRPADAGSNRLLFGMNRFAGAVSYALPFSTGVTLYVAATDLMPEVNKHHQEYGMRMPLVVFLGVALFWVTEGALEILQP